MNKSNSLKKLANTRSRSVGAAVAGALLSFGMLLAVTAIAFFAWMAEEVFEGDSMAFDNAVREFVHSYAAGWLTGVMHFFSFLGSTAFLATVTVLLAGALLYMGRRRSAVLLAVVMVGVIPLNYVLKTYFVRARPEAYFDTPLPASFSFPSGHSLFSACFFGVLAWLIASRTNSLAIKIGAWTLAAVIVLFIGLSRIYLGVHFPTDVVAGYTAAFVWLSAVVLTDAIVARSLLPRKQ